MIVSSGGLGLETRILLDARIVYKGAQNDRLHRLRRIGIFLDDPSGYVASRLWVSLSPS